jgi:hypothetical protein
MRLRPDERDPQRWREEMQQFVRLQPTAALRCALMCDDILMILIDLGLLPSQSSLINVFLSEVYY